MLETERLIVRELTLEDAAFIHALMTSPLYLKNIGDRNIRSIEHAEAFLENNIIKSYQDNGYGLYAVVLKQTNQVVGMSGLVRREGLPHTDIGFGFLPEFMGKGYAYEASKAVMDYAQNVLELNPILAITVKDNVRSISLLNKLGLGYGRFIDWEGEEILLLSTHSHS
ncbi:GNAT family N-acetyltransferase [uncultured Shewanella sp.]|uniref:GNAT family N-acetyltransferase n=1 Tax=uncultured Shewanella sp. TaxID=173975 RepID=UPI002626AAE5|nr:GNAT family N-acetyltransferase [uncultured Shewanella sp.]